VPPLTFFGESFELRLAIDIRGRFEIELAPARKPVSNLDLYARIINQCAFNIVHSEDNWKKGQLLHHEPWRLELATWAGFNPTGSQPSRRATCELLRVTNDGGYFEVEVLLLSEVCSPASVAQTLYRETETSKELRQKAAAE